MFVLASVVAPRYDSILMNSQTQKPSLGSIQMESVNQSGDGFPDHTPCTPEIVVIDLRDSDESSNQSDIISDPLLISNYSKVTRRK